MVLKEQIWAGKPVLTTGCKDGRPFSFGYAKAKLILAQLDTIRSFVAKVERATPEPTMASIRQKFASNTKAIRKVKIGIAFVNGKWTDVYK